MTKHLMSKIPLLITILYVLIEIFIIYRFLTCEGWMCLAYGVTMFYPSGYIVFDLIIDNIPGYSIFAYNGSAFWIPALITIIMNILLVYFSTFFIRNVLFLIYKRIISYFK